MLFTRFCNITVGKYESSDKKKYNFLSNVFYIYIVILNWIYSSRLAGTAHGCTPSPISRGPSKRNCTSQVKEKKIISSNGQMTGVFQKVSRTVRSAMINSCWNWTKKTSQRNLPLITLFLLLSSTFLFLFFLFPHSSCRFDKRIAPFFNQSTGRRGTNEFIPSECQKEDFFICLLCAPVGNAYKWHDLMLSANFLY